MNRPNTLLEQVASNAALLAAWKRIDPRTAPGCDGVTHEQFAVGVHRRLETLADQLRGCWYYPEPLRRVSIPKPNGSTRDLQIPTIRDRIVQTAILSVLEPILEPLFSPHSFAFRQGKSAQQAVLDVKRSMQHGYGYFLSMDIRAYFDRISVARLRNKLDETVGDPRLIQLIMRLYRGKSHGIPQGSPLSPILANLYLTDFDLAVVCPHLRYFRYADNLLFMARDSASLLSVGESARIQLTNLDLELSHDCLFDPSKPLNWLGFEIHPEFLEPSWKNVRKFLGAYREKCGNETMAKDFWRSWSSHFRISGGRRLQGLAFYLRQVA